MLVRTANGPEADFIRLVRGWFKMIAAGRWDAAFALIDLPPNLGLPHTPERFRHEIEQDHFVPGTVFANAHPEGVIYSDPDSVAGDGRPNLYQRNTPEVLEFEHDVPLNGEWSDLTSGWEFVVCAEGYLVRLDWLHVL
jgi:hypothetical protein